MSCEGFFILAALRDTGKGRAVVIPRPKAEESQSSHWQRLRSFASLRMTERSRADFAFFTELGSAILGSENGLSKKNVREIRENRRILRQAMGECGIEGRGLCGLCAG